MVIEESDKVKYNKKVIITCSALVIIVFIVILGIKVFKSSVYNNTVLKTNGVACISSKECASRFCNPTTHLCQSTSSTTTSKGNGASCSSHKECASHFCNPTTNLCQSTSSTTTSKANGASCSSHKECASGYCDSTSKTCQNPSNSSNSTNNNDNNNNNNNNSSSNDSEEEVEHCYMKIGSGEDNLYCYGTSTDCSDYDQVLDDVSRANCYEQNACYERNNKYYIGKFSKQNDYTYYGSNCPACYKNSKGKYYWTSNPIDGDTLIEKIDLQEKCVTPFNYMKLILYIAIAIVIIVVIVIIVKLFIKKRRNRKNNVSSYYYENY